MIVMERDWKITFSDEGTINVSLSIDIAWPAEYDQHHPFLFPTGCIKLSVISDRKYSCP